MRNYVTLIFVLLTVSAQADPCAQWRGNDYWSQVILAMLINWGYCVANPNANLSCSDESGVFACTPEGATWSSVCADHTAANAPCNDPTWGSCWRRHCPAQCGCPPDGYRHVGDGQCEQGYYTTSTEATLDECVSTCNGEAQCKFIAFKANSCMRYHGPWDYQQPDGCWLAGPMEGYQGGCDNRGAVGGGWTAYQKMNTRRRVEGANDGMRLERLGLVLTGRLENGGETGDRN